MLRYSIRIYNCLEQQQPPEQLLQLSDISPFYNADLQLPPLFEIYSDRLEITSYGGLVEGLSREEFFNGVSMPRNRELMRIFKDLDLVEHIGSGMGRIMTVYNKDNFEFMEHFLRIKIPFEKGYELAEQNKSSEKSREKGREKSRKKILELMSANPTITMSEIAQQLELTSKAIEKQISQLKKENKIKRIGGRKEGHWEVL